MKTVITSDEMYPFYDSEPRFVDRESYSAYIRDIPDEQMKNWNRVMEEFWRVQKEMESYYAKSK